MQSHDFQFGASSQAGREHGCDYPIELDSWRDFATRTAQRKCQAKAGQASRPAWAKLACLVSLWRCCESESNRIHSWPV